MADFPNRLNLMVYLINMGIMFQHLSGNHLWNCSSYLQCFYFITMSNISNPKSPCPQLFIWMLREIISVLSPVIDTLFLLQFYHFSRVFLSFIYPTFEIISIWGIEEHHQFLNLFICWQLKDNLCDTWTQNTSTY